MARITQIKVPNDNTTYNLSIPFIIGTGTTAGTWLGSLENLTAYYDGLMFLYKPSVAGASTTTLNINSLGAKTVYVNNTTKLTTHFPANQPIVLVYSASQNSGCWMCVDNYYASNTHRPIQMNGTQILGNNTTPLNLVAGDNITLTNDDGAVTFEPDITPVKSVETPCALATFEGAALPMPSLKVSVEAKQDLHGYDHPWAGGAGKNKLPVTLTSLKSINTSGTWTGNTYNRRGVDLEVLTDDGNNVIGIKTTGTATGGNIYFRLVPNTFDIQSGTILSGCPIGGSTDTYMLQLLQSDDSTGIANDIGDGVNISANYTDVNMYIRIMSGVTLNGIVFKPMVRLSSVSDATFAPYSNICPISGWDEAKVSDTDDVDNPTVTQTTTISLGQTVYGGEVDVVNGGGKSTYAYVELPSTGWGQESGVSNLFTNYAIKAITGYPQLICSHSVRAYNYTDVFNNDGKIALSTSRVLWHESSFANVEELEQYLANNTVQIAYELATPTTFETQPTLIKSLNGINNLSVDSGDVVELHYVRPEYDEITAKVADMAGSLMCSAGTATNPVYINNGVPTACTYELNATVPSNAIFTDTKTRQTLRATQNEKRPLLMSYAQNTSTTSNVDNVTYRNNEMYYHISEKTIHVPNVNGQSVTLVAADGDTAGCKQVYDATTKSLNFIFTD